MDQILISYIEAAVDDDTVYIDVVMLQKVFLKSTASAEGKIACERTV